MKRYFTNNEKETMQFAKDLVKEIKKGTVIALTGDLGAGKTAFVKGFAKGLSISEHILSPTFTLLRQYEGLNHFDVYRIDDISELLEIGFNEFLDDENITIIEWANLIYDILPSDVTYIDIKKGEQDNNRIITISSEVIA